MLAWRRLGAIAFGGLLFAAACGAPSEEEVKEEFEAFVAARNQCTADDDCVLAAANCPLGCYAAVNRQHQAEVEKKARELVEEYQSGGRSCAYGCVGAVPACQDGRCAAVPE